MTGRVLVFLLSIFVLVAFLFLLVTVLVMVFVIRIIYFSFTLCIIASQEKHMKVGFISFHYLFEKA